MVGPKPIVLPCVEQKPFFAVQGQGPRRHGDQQQQEGYNSEPVKHPPAGAFHRRELYRASVDQLEQILNLPNRL